ncbi:pyridoxamine 5'-phosphate oxidase family protein [Ekhidna sp.]|uniref:pyridoxamine 5'-phosphate oxidase family protein n=1 Tax=Ekhidna sp. TaxID=2608089 RepID=UPI003B5BF15B
MNKEIRDYIDKSVLCWLATATPSGEPNVSPKEVFAAYGDEIIVANIASPQTVKNIKQNSQVCISFIDVFVQKGYQIKGEAEIVTPDSEGYTEMEAELLKLTNGEFPFVSITRISIKQSKAIIAPRYILYPDTTEQQQVENALKTYHVQSVK